jgi:hypothetical protein
MAVMNFAWICFWVAAASVELGLSALYHAETFLWIGFAAVLMVAFNLHPHIRTAARALGGVVAYAHKRGPDARRGTLR